MDARPHGAPAAPGVGTTHKTPREGLNAGARIALFVAGLVVVFFAAFGIASLVAPDGVADHGNTPTHSPAHTDPAGH